MRMLKWTVIVALWLSSSFAFAANIDMGDVALIEDVDGTILSATATPNIWLQRAACAFYTTHGDYYDALFIFNTKPANPMNNNQQGWTVRNPNKGIGRGDWDVSKNFCTATKRLRITVSMGGIVNLQPDPDKLSNILPMYPLTGIELLLHEFGHHWMAAANFDKGDGKGTQCMMRAWASTGSSGGRKDSSICNDHDINGYNQHWSHYLNGCSLMYSHCIEDKGVGTDGQHHFLFSYPFAKYSQLDQYLMGLRTKDEVTDPIFVVYTENTIDGSDAGPMMHTSTPSDMTGERVDVTIDDIIRANGPREPERDICHWKAAFLLVHPNGVKATPAQIQAVENYRKRLETAYPTATDNLGSFDTSLYGCGTGTATCPGKPSVICGTESDGDTDAEAETQPVDGDTDTEAVENETPADGDSESVTEPADGDTSEATDLDKDGTTEPPLDGDTSEAGEEGCTPNAKRCMRNNPQKCSANGQAWIDTDDCAAAGKVCDSKTVTCVASSDGGSKGGCSTTLGALGWVLGSLFGLLALRLRRHRLLSAK